jgi:hypothetical protein
MPTLMPRRSQRSTLAPMDANSATSSEIASKRLWSTTTTSLARGSHRDSDSRHARNDSVRPMVGITTETSATSVIAPASAGSEASSPPVRRSTAAMVRSCR